MWNLKIRQSILFIAISCEILFSCILGWYLFILASLVLAVIIGCFMYILNEGQKRRGRLKHEFLHRSKDAKISQFEEYITNKYNERHSMSASGTLDNVLEQILDNVMRDFVDSWYQQISQDDYLFKESLKRLTRRSIAALTSCLRKVDWLSLLTHDLVDDFASHLKIYRKSKERVQENKVKQNKYNISVDELESAFFDIELEMEKNYCRDLVSTSPSCERSYLNDISGILLYLVMPPEDFRSKPLRFLMQDILVEHLFIPLLNILSDPLFINRTIVWLLSEITFDVNDFILLLEMSTSVQELESILEFLKDESNLLARGSQSEQLATSEYVEDIIKKRMYFLVNKPSTIDANLFQKIEIFSPEDLCQEEVVQLPIMMVLTHVTALTYFVEYMTKFGGQNYIDFFMAIEGFNASVDHQFQGLAQGPQGGVDRAEIVETIQEAALFIYHQFLSQEAITRVPIDESITNKFLFRMRSGDSPDIWFELVQEKIVEILSKDDRFYPGFKKHELYLRMLDDLGVTSINEDDVAEELDDTDDQQRHSPLSISSTDSSEYKKTVNDSANQSNVEPNKTTIFIETLGIGRRGTQTFALYNVRVTKTDANGRSIASWNTIRRYSDFHTLHGIIINRFVNLRTLSFPGKKTFKNLDQAFLEKRRKALEAYMNCILQPSVICANPGLERLVFDFLSQKRYTGQVEAFPKRIANVMFDPILRRVGSGVRAVGTAAVSLPDQMIDGIGSLTTQVLKASGVRVKSATDLTDTDRVAAGLINENESGETIPLRVLLLFVDEIFGLRAKNQWFRKRLVSMLQQFIHSAFGSAINKRIVDAVNWICSEPQVAQYLIALRDMFWDESGTIKVENRHHQPSESLKTRFLSRFLMLSLVPDQLRLFIGDSTTIAGINDISDALHNPRLNRRFWYVVFERLLCNVFPKNRFDKILPKLHSKSPRAHFS